MSQQRQPWPLFDLFLDVPHPAASKSCPGPFLIPPPGDASMADAIHKNLNQILRFAFPEYDDQQQQQQQQKIESELNQYDVYAMQSARGTDASFFTFSWQLQSGQRLHGHVRRHLPPHRAARARYDVGRRGERALVLVTRASGADRLYAAILKSIEAISAQQAALLRTPHGGQPQRWFLHQLCARQQHLTQVYAAQPPEKRGRPLVAAVAGLEVGDDPRIFLDFDVTRFLMPPSLLRPPDQLEHPDDISILPLLRCVGVAHALRIMAALLSERRVIMISSSPTRLARCSHAAVSMLAQGLLHWHHVYIPVLPPHLWTYLAAPYPYLIGILTHTSPRLDRTEGLGEVLMIHLDTNQMETRGMEESVQHQRLPDLFRSAAATVREGVESVAAAASASEQLAQDLMEVLKQDKKILYGESTLQNMGETAAKATKAMKNTFFKLRDKGRQYLQQRSGSELAQPSTPPPEPAEQEPPTMAPDYLYTEGCHNEVTEEEARIAFTVFFLCMLGDMRWYLSTSPGDPSQPPKLDRQRYLQQKRAAGDGEGTPLWPLLQNFCQTQMFEEFAAARVQEVQQRQVMSVESPLFLQCSQYHRQHQVDFGLLSVRRIAQQVAEQNPASFQTNARRTAMSLTSNKTFEGDYGRAIASLVDQCRESTSVLFDVMSVIWLRLRDSKGMQWKHGYQALQILRNLLYHGPLAAIAEATDGLDKIRAMKFYENMRSQSAHQVRTAAAVVYNLLVDRAKLFHIRRVCTDRRRALQDPNPPKLVRDRNATFALPFRSIHIAMNPNARGTIAQIPPMAQGGGPAPPQQKSSQEADFFASSAQSTPQATTPSVSQDMLGLFDSMAVSSQSTASNVPAPSNPFDPFIAPAQSATSSEGQLSAPSSGNAPALGPAVATTAQRPIQPSTSPVPAAGIAPPGVGSQAPIAAAAQNRALTPPGAAVSPVPSQPQPGQATQHWPAATPTMAALPGQPLQQPSVVPPTTRTISSQPATGHQQPYAQPGLSQTQQFQGQGQPGAPGVQYAGTLQGVPHGYMSQPPAAQTQYQAGQSQRPYAGAPVPPPGGYVPQQQAAGGGYVPQQQQQPPQFVPPPNSNNVQPQYPGQQQPASRRTGASQFDPFAKR